MSASVYGVGSLVRFTANFTDADSLPADPTTVIFHYKAYNIAQTTLTYGTDAALVRVGVGEYYVELSMTHAGAWYYRFEGTGVVQAADEDFITVKESVFA